jgi:hypothetical protein
MISSVPSKRWEMTRDRVASPTLIVVWPPHLWVGMRNVGTVITIITMEERDNRTHANLRCLTQPTELAAPSAGQRGYRSWGDESARAESSVQPSSLMVAEMAISDG